MELKPGYKMTEVGVIPEDWKISLIEELVETSSGTTPARSFYDDYYKNGEIPWVKTMDLTNSDVWQTIECITDLAFKEANLNLYPIGTVLVAMYGGFQQIGRTGLLKLAATVNQAITAIYPNPQEIIPEYLLETLNYHISYWRTVASSSRKDPNITRKDIRLFPIAYPSVYEQRAIAEALSDTDNLIEALDRLIAKKRDLKQAAMQELLTGKTRLPGFGGEWEVKRLGDHATFLKNGTNSRAELAPDYPIKYLHYGDIHGSSAVMLDPLNLPSLPLYKAQSLDRLQDGDLVFADASEDLEGVGKSVEIHRLDRIELVSGLHTIAVRFDKNVLADRFKAYLQFCPTFREHLRRLASGTKVYATNRAHIAGLEMHLPGTEEQTAIAEILSDLDGEIAALEARRDKTRALKQGMMAELLTGKTRLL